MNSEEKIVDTFEIKFERYDDRDRRSGETKNYINERIIRTHFDEISVIAYLSCSVETAEYARRYRNVGDAAIKSDEVLWLDLNFSGALHSSSWGTRHERDQILAIHIARAGFEYLLGVAEERSATSGSEVQGIDTGVNSVLLYWVPNHSSVGEKDRPVPQLGIGVEILKTLNNEWISYIQNITPFVVTQRQLLKREKLEELMTPRECVFTRWSRDENTTGHPSPESRSDECRHPSAGQCSSTDGSAQVPLLSSFDNNTECDGVNEASNYCEGDRKTCIPRKVILCLGGAFNPVHTRHIMVMLKAKEWLEQNTDFEVVAGRLAVAPDGYVKAKTRKSNDLCIQGHHRLRMCELACENYREWLQPYFKTIGSARDCGKKTKQELQSTGEQSDHYLASIIGADRAITSRGAKWTKHYDHDNDITVCIGRQGETSKIIDLYEKDKLQGKVSQRFFIVPSGLDDVSSTGVRRVLSKVQQSDSDEEKLMLIQTLVQDGLVCEAEGQYILQNEDSLYLTT